MRRALLAALARGRVGVGALREYVRGWLATIDERGAAPGLREHRRYVEQHAADYPVISASEILDYIP